MKVEMKWIVYGLGLITILLSGCALLIGVEGHIVFETYRDGDAEIYLMDVDGTSLVNLTKNEAYDGIPSWGPNGKQIAFTTERTGNPEIFFMQEDGQGVQQVTDGAGFNVAPAWSPDGKLILFTSNRTYFIHLEGGDLEVPGNSKLWSVDLDGRNPDRLTSILGLDMYGSWSPDGAEVVYMSVRDDNPEIYILRSNGTEENLTNHDSADLNPSWSPDGTKIAFMSDREGNMEIFIMDLANDNSLANISNHPANEGDPDWSPDGKHLVFTSDRDGNIEIYVMESDGSNPRRITNDPADDIHPQWQPHS